MRLLYGTFTFDLQGLCNLDIEAIGVMNFHSRSSEILAGVQFRLAH